MSTAGADLGAFLAETRTNAILGWILFTILLGTAATNLLLGNRLWALFAVGLAGLVVIPPVAFRSPESMIPWEVVLLAAVPVLSYSLVAESLLGRTTMYLSVAAIALVIAVELHTFTPVQMTVGFAVLFVVVATMATAGVWAVVRWMSDLYLGTAFILDPALTAEAQEEQLMWDFVASTLAGIVAGLLFQFYVRRRARARDRLPEQVTA